MLPYHERPYRPCVAIMLVNSAGLIFAGQRIDQVAEAWQMPQGGIDEGESPAAAARRELLEETGTDRAELLAESREWHPYDLPEAIADQVWHGRYRGQTQKWFCMRFTGNDGDFRVGDVAEPEFDTWTWMPPDRLIQASAPFKREVYQAVIREFRAHLV